METTLKVTTIAAPYANPMGMGAVTLTTADCGDGHYTVALTQELHFESLAEAVAAFAQIENDVCEQPQATLLVHRLDADELAAWDAKGDK